MSYNDSSNCSVVNDFSMFTGNTALHLMTSQSPSELRVDLGKADGSRAFAKYSTFSVAAESDAFRLSVGGYSGNAGRSI